MLALYIVSAVLGGGLVVASAIGGLGDHSFEFDHGADVDTDHDIGAHDHGTADVNHGADFWLPFFSLRFWVYAIGMFGAFGLFLTLTKLATEPTVAIAAAITGTLMGTIAATAMRLAKRAETNSSVSEHDLIGVQGRLTVSPREGSPGKVRVQVKGDLIDMLAVPVEGLDLATGEDVVIVGIEGQHALVDRMTNYMGD